ncbi:MAG TPA: CPBP family intramembrane glutamic endopeptidase [Candidatus Limnocylindrales bacterium]|nr:CPBP family intramembrane glutamic endopeptidase [Candidatus Limnocylindrales bacterium]
MISVVSVGAPTAVPRRWVWTVLVAVAATAAVMAVALTNQPYFDLLNRWVGGVDPLGRGALYSSYLLLIGLAFVVRRPAAYGIRLGDTVARWRLVTGAVAGMAALTAIVLVLLPTTPYADASWLNEVVIVPVTEELVFRGVLITLVLAALSRLHSPSPAAIMAVSIGALAFGLGHAANIFTLPAGFVIAQVTYAILIGLVAGTVMVRTRSIVPAILVHAAVNAVVVAF